LIRVNPRSSAVRFCFSDYGDDGDAARSRQLLGFFQLELGFVFFQKGAEIVDLI
jgi:hypothetical protein